MPRDAVVEKAEEYPREGENRTDSAKGKIEMLTAQFEGQFSRRRTLPVLGPRLPIVASQQVGSYLGYTGHHINVVVAAPYAEMTHAAF